MLPENITEGKFKVVKKLWGKEEWRINNELYCMKVLTIDPGGCSSEHNHLIKDETFIVVEGYGFLSLGNVQDIQLSPGLVVRIKRLVKHMFWVPASLEKPCIVHEVSTHHDDDDVTRFSESKILQLGEKPKWTGENS